MIGLVGAVLIGCAVAWVAERYGLSRLGLPSALVVAVGGAVVAYMIFFMFGIGLYGRGVTAAVGAALALVLAPSPNR